MSWQLGSVIVLSVALALGFASYERSRPPARALALVAVLAALGAIGRVAFAAFPNVKPTTDIVLFAGFAFGGPAGFAVGSLAALISNVFLGQGPWTPWQMASWAIIGLAGAGLGRLYRGKQPSRIALAVICALAGFVFGAVMDLYQWTFAAEHTLSSYLVVSGTSLTFNIAHAVGNFVFALLIGPAFIRSLERYRRRSRVRWLPAAPRAAAGGVAAIALGLALAAPQPAAAAPPSDVAPVIARAVHYLRFSQNGDGGFGAARGASSTSLHTGWAALGLASAGRNPRDLTQRGHSVIDFVSAHSSSLGDIGELERTMLVLRAAGLPQRLGSRNLLRSLVAKQRGDGSFGAVSHTAFGVFALRAAGREANSKEVRAATGFLLKAQNGDGGFGFAKGAASDVDDTASVMQALAAGGRKGAPAIGRAVSYVRKAQRPDGGFGQMVGADSNAQSTAFAVQGLVAVGRNPRKFKRTRTPIEYLKSLQADDGSVRYSRTSAQTPVWVTAQALVALEGKAYPLRPAPRKKARTASGTTGGTSGSTSAGGSAAGGAGTSGSSGSGAGSAAVTGGAFASSALGSERGSSGPARAPKRPRAHAADRASSSGARLGTSAPEIDVKPAAQTTTQTTNAPGTSSANKGKGSYWPFVFAVLIGGAMLILIRLAWRRGE